MRSIPPRPVQGSSAVPRSSAPRALSGRGAGGAGAVPALLGASSAAAAVKSKKIAVIEQQFGTFFTANFNKPAQAYVKKAPGWSVTFGNENNTVTTGINLLNSYVSQGYGVLIL